MIILEAGLNHLGNIKIANKMLRHFLSSNSKHLTFMLHNKKFYQSSKKNNYKLPKSFYKKALVLAHKKNKKIGLSVCDTKTFNELSDLKFDFYKLLGIAINNKHLIQQLKKKKKSVYISLAKGSDASIQKCLKLFESKSRLNLIYTSMSYSEKDIDINRINYLKDKFRLPVGYGHHFKNFLPIYLSTYLKPDFYFFYIKLRSNLKLRYPDNDHALFENELDKVEADIKSIKIILKRKKLNTKIKLGNQA